MTIAQVGQLREFVLQGSPKRSGYLDLTGVDEVMSPAAIALFDPLF